MAEVIGVAASAAQLGAVCFTLIDILRKSLSISIYENPLLQTPEIGTQTKALLSTIDNNCINSLLKKGRLLRAWGFLYREQDLVDIFATIEQQKSTLCLAINQIQSKAFYQIKTDIEKMSSNTVVNDTTTKSQNGSPLEFLFRGETSQNSLSLRKELDRIGLSGPPATSSVMVVQHLANSSAKRTTTIMSSPANSNDLAGARFEQAGPQWNRCQTDPGFHQENRRIYKINGPLSKELAKNKPIQCTFNEGLKLGRGNQNNRHHIKFVGDISGAVVPNMDHDRWNDCNIKACATEDAKGHILGTQFNGIEIEYEEAATDAKSG
ncbi:hypothetical protein FLAG1_11086 [Fusarium langsethiae]|uniref:Uncharacterized protein n=1 Tax=Fusarium langsethiae TaxID=179993 RepID=A0A0M9ENB3_FUSLA|nr:hypothetical protein FLAG1_11086 [Fusarium langsethiae]GKU08276.1 unnamed protein product [Fusarium langsethiae]GKU09808.1 unnamed protein product [Fusarium langsethiae]